MTWRGRVGYPCGRGGAWPSRPFKRPLSPTAWPKSNRTGVGAPHATVLKTVGRATPVPRVRISPPPLSRAKSQSWRAISTRASRRGSKPVGRSRPLETARAGRRLSRNCRARPAAATAGVLPKSHCSQSRARRGPAGLRGLRSDDIGRIDVAVLLRGDNPRVPANRRRSRAALASGREHQRRDQRLTGGRQRLGCANVGYRALCEALDAAREVELQPSRYRSGKRRDDDRAEPHRVPYVSHCGERIGVTDDADSPEASRP